MKWSVSKSKTFLTCQRKWFYSDIFAAWNAKDPLRREAYLLSNLQSIQAWRGSLVDTVIEKFIITKMVFDNRVPSIDETIRYANYLIERQVKFGNDRLFRTVSKTNAKNDYAAFFDLEYKGKLAENAISLAIAEIHTALKNLISSGLLQQTLDTPGVKILPQRSMQIPAHGFTVVSVPDLIILYPDKPPLIIDWKVNAGRNTDYWLQLGIYAYVLHTLCSTNPHRDFPDYHRNPDYKPHDIDLIEFQLLSNTQKRYKLTENELWGIEDYIYKYGSIMFTFFEDEKLDSLNYQTAYSPNTCLSCGFQKLCWEVVKND